MYQKNLLKDIFCSNQLSFVKLWNYSPMSILVTNNCAENKKRADKIYDFIMKEQRKWIFNTFSW